MRSALGLLMPFAFVLGSCGIASHSGSELSIYGGNEVAEGHWPSTVALTEDNQIFCSGTAINPWIVITAAHCLTDDSAANMQVHLGNGSEGGALTGSYEVEKIAYNSKYRENDPEYGYDVGYLKLKTPLALPKEAYVSILTDPEEMAELFRGGSDAYLVGFGGRKKNGYGVKYEVKAMVRRYSKVEIRLGGNGRDACQGDSGGPAYGLLANGQWRVYGVTSRGGNCGNGGDWGLMHPSICWVQQDSGVTLDLPQGYCRGAELAQAITVKFSKAKNTRKD